MALGSALATARNSLRVSSGQMNVVSQNIAGARDPNYVRRTNHTHMLVYGGVYGTVKREGNPYLLANHLNKTSEAMASNIIASGITQLSNIYAADDFTRSPARLLTEFRDSLQTWYNQFDQSGSGDAAIARAKELALSLNEGSQEIARLRHDADQDIKASVDRVNDLLERFHNVNQMVMQSTATGRNLDAYSYMDERDALVKQLSEEIGIHTVEHKDGSMTIYGMDGSTLYDRKPRQITFTPAAALPAGAEGGAVYIDGVPVTHSSFRDPNGSGTLGGLLKLRDEIAPQYQKQLDEIANALLDGFPEIFEDRVPGDTTGLSGQLAVKAALDFEKGGNASAIGSRDKVLELVNAFDKTRDYDGNTGISGSLTLLKYADNSLAWIENRRKDATGQAQYRETMYMRSAETLSNETGVNTDDELALMLQLEQSYSATAKIISAVGKMMDDLMAAIR